MNTPRIDSHKAIESKELSWRKAYKIQTICAVGGFAIDDDWSGGKDLKDNYKAIYHKTFAFFLKSQIDRACLIRCFENIEKLYLLYELGVASVAHISKFIQPAKGAEALIASRELIEDIADYILDAELEKETKGKEIYFFERLEWGINERKPFFVDDVVISVRARFNFLVLDRDKE